MLSKFAKLLLEKQNKLNEEKTVMRKEGFEIPTVDFVFREAGEFITRQSNELFKNKRVVVFALPGAFTPTCSAYQLPGFEEKYDEFVSLGIDEIYCLSVNDGFAMNAWAKDQNIQNVKLIPDGNADFTRSMGMLVKKNNLGFGTRSWRYAMVVDNNVIEKIFIESGLSDNAESDPYEVSTPENVLEYVKSKTRELVPV
jgi:peroxiredoxin